MNPSFAAPVILYNGQQFTVENFKNIIQQRDAQGGVVLRMQENYNRLSADYCTIWYQNEYHKDELMRVQQENVFPDMQGNNAVSMRDYQMLWEEKESLRKTNEQLQQQVQNLMEIKKEAKEKPRGSEKLKKRAKKEVKEEVKTEPVQLPEGLDFSKYLYTPEGSQEVPQSVKALGWHRKFYETVTGHSTSNFDALDAASKKTWKNAYNYVEATQNAQVESGLVNLISNSRNVSKRKMSAMIGEEEIKEEVLKEEEIKEEILD